MPWTGANCSSGMNFSPDIKLLGANWFRCRPDMRRNNLRMWIKKICNNAQSLDADHYLNESASRSVTSVRIWYAPVKDDQETVFNWSGIAVWLARTYYLGTPDLLDSADDYHVIVVWPRHWADVLAHCLRREYTDQWLRSAQSIGLNGFRQADTVSVELVWGIKTSFKIRKNFHRIMSLILWNMG